MSIVLRPYQSEIVQRVRESYLAGSRAPLVWLPTGGGKTVVFCHIAGASGARGKRVLILVHRVELLRQTSKALHKSGVRHGLIHPQFKPDPTAAVQVASVQTLVKRLDKIRLDFDLIVIDEAHHANAGTWRNIIAAMPDARLLGVTATPCRTDGTGLGIEARGFFDDLILGPTVRELISMGNLVKPIIYAPKERLDLTGLRTVAGDYNKHDLDVAMDKPSITGSAVEHYARICPGTPAVAFCVSVLHAQHVAEEFRAAGFRAYHVDGGMDDEIRQRILDGLGDGTVDVVTSCDIISEGTDIPAIGCAILLRPTQSEGLYIQQVGRALRPVPGKEHAIVLDHVGNVLMHGVPEADREWSLEGTKKKKRAKTDQAEAVKVKQCTQCFAIHEPALACPQCGFRYPVMEQRKIEVQAGELQQLTEDEKAAIRVKKKQEEGQARTLEELKALAAARGYKMGWAEHRWRARQSRVS